MKFFLCMLLTCLVFSFGLYLGTTHSSPAHTAPADTTEEVTETDDVVNRETVIEELEIEESPAADEIESTVLHQTAESGAAIVRHISDQLMGATYAIVDALF
ncbi:MULTISPECIES: hypothetical protein [Gracilibacillus]|uniref:hypothetical protein n=1 Tax=Gracilibacillus TaxID=74385 RepID=UPI000824252B|nr:MULTISPECIES: hypothetical protein [Gracilibacillus]